tara:strand:+ start:16821 stop:17087 length:267 start_codon:yes stop_codon:yes gene_type:complete
MNKAFNKYGKASFKSIIPKRLKQVRAIRVAMSSALAASSLSSVSAVICASGGKAERVMAINKMVHACNLSMQRALTRSDHPIHKKAAN